MRLAMYFCLAACGRFGFSGVAHDAAANDVATATDTTTPGDTGGGCPSFALFCDGFESGDLSKWTGEDLDGPQQVTTGARYTGMYGLDSDVGSASGNGAEGDAYVAPGNVFATGTLAIREWVYSPAQLINYVGTLEVTLGPPATASQYVEIIANDVGAWSLSEFGSAGLHDHEGSIATQTATWTCVEVDIVLGSAPSASLYIDGVVSTQGPMTNTGDSYDTIAVGVTRANAGGFEVYIDDVVIATQRIGC
jgi:hypothetical protein